MNEAKIFKKKHDDWTKLYHKMLKELKVMIDVQKQIWDMMKMAEETNTMVTEMKGTILKASINNKMINAMNLLGISEDLQDLIQSNMEDQVYQIQRMLADELDRYKGRGNQYMNDNIQEIQELYKEEEQRQELKNRTIEEEEVILIQVIYKIYTCSDTNQIIQATPTLSITLL